MAKVLTCAPELLKTDLKGKRYIVTGANSGIGFQTAKQLALQGADVILACRSVGEGEARAAEIRALMPHARLEVRRLDLGDLTSVRAFADGILKDVDHLDALVNNAGVMNTPKGTTRDGFETQIGVNHLGHFLLTQLLLDLLKSSAPSRIVNVSSCYHDVAMGREGKIDLEDLNFERRKYDGWEAYAQSKLANVLHARHLAKRLQGTGVTAVSVHPGWVRTKLMRHSLPIWMQNYVLRPMFRVFGMIEPWDGAQTSLHCILAPSVPEHAGAFFSQLGIYRDKSKNAGGWPLASPNPQAVDDDLARKLWDLSESLVSPASELAKAS